MKTALVAVSLWAGMLLAPVILLGLLYFTPPNWLESPLARTLPIVPSLLASNPLAALKLLAAQPLVVLAYVEAGTGLRVWEVHLHVLSMLLLLGAAFYDARVWPRLTGARTIALFIGGLVLLAAAFNTIRVAACCTAPAWALDVWLRGLALSPAPGGIDWSEFYLRVEALLFPIQVGIACLGLVLLVAAGRAQAGSRER
jgi:hypothetical protein